MDAYTPHFREWFWKLVEKTPASCWLWLGPVNGRGYGELIDPVDGAVVGAHRVAWNLTFGYLPFVHSENPDDWKIVCHKCDFPLCVSPSHLYLGTYKRNAQDRTNKGRNRVHVDEFDVATRQASDPHGWLENYIESALNAGRIARTHGRQKAQSEINIS